MSGLPKATVVRLPRYLRLLEDVGSTRDTVSSDDLALAAGANAANVRRDLSHLDFHGVRGLGYSVSELRDRIRAELGIDKRRRVIIVGAGNLGRALANYGGLSKRGFDVAAIYDNEPDTIGADLAGMEVRSIKTLEKDLESETFDMAILAVPATAAQQVADRLVKAGVELILNFAPIRVRVPENVQVRQVDLSTELQILSYYGN
ncbi:MAG: redox-sensing transcriptional repressor Rex [Actinobacteria bacterium]|nr:MAG: redox-sensing transcriptional repressor Rex [Actinomycetota bacterium]